VCKQTTFYYNGVELTLLFRWNPERPNVRHSTDLKGHATGIEKVAFNPVKDAELCSVSSDGVVKFWDVRTKAVINEIKGLGDAFTLAWSPDGESLVVGNKVCFKCLHDPNLVIVMPFQIIISRTPGCQS
jgi:WD40 repeat protein